MKGIQTNLKMKYHDDLDIEFELTNRLYESIFKEHFKKREFTLEIYDKIYVIKYKRFLDKLRGTISLEDKLWKLKAELSHWDFSFKRIK